MGRSGAAITLASAADLPKLHEIERGLGRKLPRVSARSNGNGASPTATPPVTANIRPVRAGRGRWFSRRRRR
jgi:hypothetical protein